jgi:CRISPR/Cas system endoribonuclease Cas6 (RAMP superfamily)
MIVLTPSTSPQTFSFIPRDNTFNVMEVTDEQTNITTNIFILSTTTGDYVNTLTAIYNDLITIVLIEGHFYTLQLKNSSNEIIYKDKIFCTAQPLVTFSVNNNQYVSNTTTNEFIVYE